ncbi:MAG: DUF998 domain-containing protein [Microbacteriaceae bacterium]
MKAIKVSATVALAIAVIGVLTAPLFLHYGYSILSNSISESAAQNVPTAWIARAALFASGLAVLGVVALKSGSWSRSVSISFAIFGTLWIISSVFSTKSWVAEASFNQVESEIHSVAASAMAIIVLGALVLGFTRQPVSPIERVLAFGLAAAATFLPLASYLVPELGGLFQRVMFLYTYLWFARQVYLA